VTLAERLPGCIAGDEVGVVLIDLHDGGSGLRATWREDAVDLQLDKATSDSVVAPMLT
jgi:hypothetical protein